MKTMKSTVFHPQKNGQVERYNRSLLELLRHYVGEHQDEWGNYSSAVTYAYNMILHLSVGVTPFELVLSRLPSPLAIQHSTLKRKKGKLAEINKDYLDLLEDVIKKARGCLSDTQERHKRDFDRRVKHPQKIWRKGIGFY